MTDELRIKANQLHSEIQNLEGRIETLKAINNSCKPILICNNNIGTVSVEAEDYEPALGHIIARLTEQKEAKEDEYRML